MPNAPNPDAGRYTPMPKQTTEPERLVGRPQPAEKPWINRVLKEPAAVLTTAILFIVIAVPWAYGLVGILALIVNRR